jgi:transcriptional regulator with XRE-family HTH domain
MLNAPILLKEARAAAGLTQVELADRLGVSQSEIARLESRKANPRVETLLRAVDATGHTIEGRVRPRGANVDESMLAANLRRTPAERLDRFTRSYRNVAALTSRVRSDSGS